MSRAKSSIRESSKNEAGVIATKVRKQLQALNTCLTEDSDISTDLGDIWEVCQKCTESIETLAEGGSRSAVLKALNQVQNDLYIHLAYHLKQMRKPIQKIINQIEACSANGETA